MLNEREEAVRIAKGYKSELEQVVISDEDIQHLYNTVSRVLEIFKAMQVESAFVKGREDVDSAAA